MELSKIQIGLTSYIHNELAAKSSGMTKFLIYTGTALGVAKIENFIKDYESILTKLEIITPDGIDLEKLYSAAKLAMKETGQVEMYGIIFNEGDIDKLYNYIKNA